MSDADSLDRDLLWVILAVQLDFISLSQLGAALGNRRPGPARSLPELLSSQHAMSPDDQEIVTALVERRLAQHDNQVSRCLETLKLSEQFRRLLEDLAAPELSTRLSRIGTAADSSGDATVSFDTPAMDAGIDRYRILQLHKGGGLGQVLLAQDTRLNREVALKRIHPSRADQSQSRARLRLEAEVTGRLEHPAVVPVYDVGQDESGRPFYVMRFIRGESLKDRLKQFHHNVETGRWSAGERTLEFRKLLGHVIAVCEAAAYAHSRGTIHRDIKPANIMLGDFGETLLVDWGLTKIIGKSDHAEADDDDESTLLPGVDSGDPTAEGDTVGTLAYMSPEQAAGQLDMLTGQSDVYSLGATLYHVLTNQPPFISDTRDCRQKIMRGEFTPPEQLPAAVPKPLASVCRKAMQREPAQRYASAKDLAADIERWLADEAVKAHAESPLAAAQRFYRTHRTGVTLTSVFLFITTCGLLITSWIIAGKNIQLQRLVAQANEEQARAEGNAAVAQQFAEELLDTADQRLSQLPNQLRPRVTLTNVAANRLTELFAKNPQNASMRSFLARSLLTRANLLKTTNVKQLVEPDYKQAIHHYEGLIDHHEHGPTARDELVGALIDYADYLAASRLVEAAAQLQRADQIMATIPDQGTTNFQRTRARLLIGHAALSCDIGETQAASPLFQQAADILRSLVARTEFVLDPDLLLVALESHAESLVELEQFDDALAVLREADVVSEKYATGRKNRDDRNMRAHILLDLGKLQLHVIRDERTGIKSLQHAIEIWNQLLQEYPNYLRYHGSTADTHIALAEYNISRGELETADEQLRSAMARLEAYAKRQYFRRTRVDALACQAKLWAARKQWELAKESLLKAIDHQSEIVSAKPGNVPEQRRLLKLQEQLGVLERQRID